ncbi:hypothetical protein Tco_0128326 [Tanacetum coccineum]
MRCGLFLGAGRGWLWVVPDVGSEPFLFGIFVLLLVYAFSNMLGFVSLLHSRPYFAMVGDTIDTFTSVLTQRELDSHCSLFNIPTELWPELPDSNATIKDSLAGKIGLSRSYTETDVRPTFLYNDDKEMGLLDFFKSADPFKVKIGERTLADNKVPLLEETEDRVISLSAQPISLVDHTIEDELKANTGKKKRKGAESGSAPHPSEELMSSLVTPTPKPDVLEDSGATPDVNVQMCRVSEGFVVTTSNSEHGDTNVSLRVKSPLPHVAAGASSVPGDDARTFTSVSGEGSPVDEFYESQTIDSATAQDVYVPEWNITIDARIDNPALCRNLFDHITPLEYWSALRNQIDARFLDCFNINSAQHVCMVSELRLSSAVVQQMDAEIAALKARLEIAEKEFAELSRLRSRVSELENEVMAKSKEVAGLNKQNAELLGKVSALESAREELGNQVSKLGVDCESLRGEIVGEAKLREELMTSNNVYFIASFIPLIMEYLVNISKRRAFWSLNEDILKITILKTNTPYPSRNIRRMDNQEKNEKQSQNNKTGLGMEKTVKDKAKSKPESQSSQKVNRKVNWSKSKSTQVNPGAKVQEK